MGEKQEPEVLDEGGFTPEPGEGETAPESLNAPAETGEGDEGEGAGEGEGSEKTGGAWSKEKAAITRLQQEKADVQGKLDASERARTQAEMLVELNKRQQGQAPTQAAAKTRTPDEEAAAAAVNSIIREELGMDLPELKSALGSLKGGVGNAAIAAMDANMRADPDSYPHYAELRPTLLQYAREQGSTLDANGFEWAYSKLERPLLTRDRKAAKVAAAKAKTTRRAALDGAPLPGGGRSTSGGNRVVSRADIGNMSDDDLADALDAAVIPDLE